MTTQTELLREALELAADFIEDVHDGEWLGGDGRRNCVHTYICAALAQLTAPEQQAPKGSELAALIKALRENDLYYSYQSRLAELLARQAEAAKPLFADLIAATPGEAEELKAVDARPQAADAQPLTDLQVTDGVIREKCGVASGQFPDVAFLLGVRFAERAHGITGKDNAS